MSRVLEIGSYFSQTNENGGDRGGIVRNPESSGQPSDKG
jgi:hypothetical protein